MKKNMKKLELEPEKFQFKKIRLKKDLLSPQLKWLKNSINNKHNQSLSKNQIKDKGVKAGLQLMPNSVRGL